jgi:hypothetical protein
MKKPRFRYDTSGSWLQGNTHVHTSLSDGGKSPQEVITLYEERGYDFLFFTDHWLASDVADTVYSSNRNESRIILMDGLELDGADDKGSYYHVVCLGRFEGIHRGLDLKKALSKVSGQNAFLILAHPYWTGNTLREASRYRFHGVEIYNHVCNWINGKGLSTSYWDSLLQNDTEVMGFSADDSHFSVKHPGWNGGWIAVNCSNRDAQSIMSAIRSGNFYSSRGPRFIDIVEKNGKIHVTTSPVQFVRLIGPKHRGDRIGSFENERFENAAFDMPKDWPYLRVEIEDERGRCAWTNSLFA